MLTNIYVLCKTNDRPHPSTVSIFTVNQPADLFLNQRCKSAFVYFDGHYQCFRFVL